MSYIYKHTGPVLRRRVVLMTWRHCPFRIPTLAAFGQLSHIAVNRSCFIATKLLDPLLFLFRQGHGLFNHARTMTKSQKGLSGPASRPERGLSRPFMSWLASLVIAHESFGRRQPFAYDSGLSFCFEKPMVKPYHGVHAAMGLKGIVCASHYWSSARPFARIYDVSLRG